MIKDISVRMPDDLAEIADLQVALDRLHDLDDVIVTEDEIRVCLGQ
ncbi:MAG: hypothetical protein IID14_01385 [Candidatus Marinimicrobia bacterium]|nr:hypothetical protein [Candidatus Neomarinimicrobiota bacterium]